MATVAVGVGYTCNKGDIVKKGSATDVSTIYEMVYNTYESFGMPKNKYYVLQDGNATVANVKATLTSAVTNDLAIVYFSCKAKQVEAVDDPDEKDGLDEALVLYDGLLLDNDIWNILKNAKGRVFLVIDTNYAASMFKAVNGNTENIAEQIIDMHAEDGSILCWVACEEDETLKERSIGSKMTNTMYFMRNASDLLATYDTVFSKMQKKLDGKQHISKIVIGKDFSYRTMFR